MSENVVYCDDYTAIVGPISADLTPSAPVVVTKVIDGPDAPAEAAPVVG